MTISEGSDEGPVCCIMYGIVPDSRLVGKHVINFNGQLHARKQILMSPLEDDFIRQAALIGQVFSSKRLIYNVYQNGLTFGTTSVKGKSFYVFLSCLVYQTKSMWFCGLVSQQYICYWHCGTFQKCPGVTIEDQANILSLANQPSR
jgi:hypothetical protein